MMVRLKKNCPRALLRRDKLITVIVVTTVLTSLPFIVYVEIVKIICNAKNLMDGKINLSKYSSDVVRRTALGFSPNSLISLILLKLSAYYFIRT